MEPQVLDYISDDTIVLEKEPLEGLAAIVTLSPISTPASGNRWIHYGTRIIWKNFGRPVQHHGRHGNEKFWSGKKGICHWSHRIQRDWLCLWLSSMALMSPVTHLAPPPIPAFLNWPESVNWLIPELPTCGMQACLHAPFLSTPDIVIHMAAQPLVRDSYTIPVETYATNVMGTVTCWRRCGDVHPFMQWSMSPLTNAMKTANGSGAIGKTSPWADIDPYSSSKGCSELVTAAYRNSFFQQSSVAVATARAGNVIGGGDWATDRLIPDCINALLAGQPIRIRNPHAIRPWQHVLEPLSGYLTLARKAL